MNHGMAFLPTSIPKLSFALNFKSIFCGFVSPSEAVFGIMTTVFKDDSGDVHLTWGQSYLSGSAIRI